MKHRATFTPDPIVRGWVNVEFPYIADYVQAIKDTVPSHQRSWDPKRKIWSIHSAYQDTLSSAFSWVETIQNSYTKTSQQRRTTQAPPTAPTGTVDVLRELFRVLPEHLRQPAHRALVKVAHPDVGGDHEFAVALNAVWQEVAAA